LLDQESPSSEPKLDFTTEYEVYQNKNSKMHESILVQHHLSNNSFSVHIYAFILEDVFNNKHSNGAIIDLRKGVPKDISNPLKVIGTIKRGSLSFIRYFLKNPDEKKYQEKMKEKYQGKKSPQKKRYFPSTILLIAHFCDNYLYPDDITKDELKEYIKNALLNFDDLIQDDIHFTFKALGKPLYLRGENSLIHFHQTRDLPLILVEKLQDEKLLQTATQQKHFSMLVPVVKGMRKDIQEQEPILKKIADPQAISHIFTVKDEFLPFPESRFPIVVVGEEETRRNIILNILGNANARFLILDPKENYGKLTTIDPRIRGYILGENYYLNIISTEGERIREQIYSYWFARIIANTTGLRSEITKTLETYLLGAYRDPNNQTKSDFQFRDFANQALTSEIAKMGRNESSIVSNVLYPLGTYDEISVLTRIGRSFSFDTLFDTKGAIIQFSKKDDQLTKIAYLFTILKLRSITNEDPKIIVLENLDDYIGSDSTNWQNQNDLTDLILGLAEDYHLIISARSPSKITELFKNTQTKFINRLLVMADKYLLMNEFNFTKKDSINLNKLSEKEFYILLSELTSPNIIKVDSQPNTKMKLKIDKLEKESNFRILNSKEHLRTEGIPPEIRRTIFEIIKILREKPRKMIPEEGLEALIPDSSEADVLRAKEIAREESFIKIIENAPSDTNESISLLKLTERGEEYYKSYLDLKKKIPLISFKTLVAEKNFEKDIFSKLAKIEDYFSIGDNSSAVDLMVDITVNLLGALPEKDRFVKGKNAALLLDHWSYLSSLKDAGDLSRAKRLYQEFSQAIANSLKMVKHTTLKKEEQWKDEREDLKKTYDDEEDGDQSKKKVKITRKSEIETKEPKNLTTKIDPWEKQIEVMEDNGLEEDSELEEQDLHANNGSLFVAASKDLKSAGLPHIDSSGVPYNPKKGRIFDDGFFDKLEDPISEKELELPDKDPFSPKTNSKDLNKNKANKQKVKLDKIKKKLMIEIAKHMEITEIDDEDFIWHCLVTRFNGKMDDGYTISDIVSTLKTLYTEVKDGGILDNSILEELESKIIKKNLLSEKLMSDLRQYIHDV